MERGSRWGGRTRKTKGDGRREEEEEERVGA